MLSILSTKRESHVAIDPWKLVETTWDSTRHMESESLFSIGNGRMGQRANHEEAYSGETLLGSYIAGVYYPDKTKVGWWKNGYPEYFAKVLNAVHWIGVDIQVNGETVDLNRCVVTSFRRELNMRTGLLSRSFTVVLSDGCTLSATVERFVSMVRDEIGALSYTLQWDRDAHVSVSPFLDFNVTNHDSNWDEIFWTQQGSESHPTGGSVTAETKKTAFRVSASQEVQLSNAPSAPRYSHREGFTQTSWDFQAAAGTVYTLEKVVGIVSSFNAEAEAVPARAAARAAEAAAAGYAVLREEHVAAWDAKWALADIAITGDDACQQGIRFNIFHLLQTFTGVDERLNIGPKGFTGEKYGGSTYWDTEAYCLPFYLASADPKVARNLLVYRYKHLDRAIENAEKLGFSNGAALYPMVTMNGEECHNEWEITFEEIHRNGAIAYGIYTYIRHTLDYGVLAEFGVEVLVAIARFWAQRVQWSSHKQKYVLLGVTGPNEYENNVNNNYYTNFMAVWCLEYAAEAMAYVKEHQPQRYAEIGQKINWDEVVEWDRWNHIRANMYYPYWEEKGIFLQQDGFLDKDLVPVAEMDQKHRPINQKWSWDRILRSPYIKQADTLQGFFFFEDRTDRDLLRRHYDFYEPFTVHESSLSPCIHTVLASRLGYAEQAYHFYLRTARLDLDDYNNEVKEGLHVTAMGGAWMSVVQGFGGMRLVGTQLTFEPYLPKQWEKLAFSLVWRGAILRITLTENQLVVENLEGPSIDFSVKGISYAVTPTLPVTLQLVRS